MKKASENKANKSRERQQSENAEPETDTDNNNEDTIGTRTFKLEQDLWPDDEADKKDAGDLDTENN